MEVDLGNVRMVRVAFRCANQGIDSLSILLDRIRKGKSVNLPQHFRIRNMEWVVVPRIFMAGIMAVALRMRVPRGMSMLPVAVMVHSMSLGQD